MPGEITVSTKTDNREFPNLVGKNVSKDLLIPKDKQKEIGKMVVEDRDTDLESRTEWAEKRDRWYKLWTLSRDPKNDPWPECSNICIPLFAIAANQFHGRAYQSIFGAPQLLNALPISRNDVRRAKNTEDYMNYQFKHEIEGYEENTDKNLLNLPINGITFEKFMYSKELEHPTSDYISALDLVLPFKTKSLETARRITHDIRLHWDEMLDRFEQDIFVNKDQVNENPSLSAKEEALTKTAEKIAGENTSKQKEEPHIILESHRKYDLGDGRKPYIFTVDMSTGTLFRAVSRDFKVGATTKTLNYFTDYHFIPNPEGFYSFGFGHFLEVLNEMANTAFNQIFDSGSLTNQPFGFYGRRAGFKKKKISLTPGNMIEVEDATQINFPQMQRVDNVLFMVLGLIQDYSERFTSVTDNISGRQQRGVERPTATGTIALIEQGLTTFSAIVKRYYRGMKKEFQLVKLQNEIFLTDSKEFRISGSSKKIAFSDIKNEDFGGVKDIVPVADPSFASKQIRRQEALQLHQITMQNLLVIGTPPPGEGQEPAIKPNLKAMMASTKMLYAPFEEPHTQELIDAIEETIPPTSIPPDEENAMYMQGDISIPLPEEDHIAHFLVHSEFIRSDAYKDMPEEYEKLFLDHLALTQTLAVAQAQQAAAQAQENNFA